MARAVTLTMTLAMTPTLIPIPTPTLTLTAIVMAIPTLPSSCGSNGRPWWGATYMCSWN